MDVVSAPGSGQRVHHARTCARTAQESVLLRKGDDYEQKFADIGWSRMTATCVKRCATRWQLAGYETVGLPDAQSALDYLAQQAAGLVISDIQMKSMDGHSC